MFRKMPERRSLVCQSKLAKRQQPSPRASPCSLTLRRTRFTLQALAWPCHAQPEGRSVVPLAGSRLVP